MNRIVKLVSLSALAALAACSQGSDSSSSTTNDPQTGGANGVALAPVSVTGSDAVDADDFGKAAVAFVENRKTELALTARDTVRVRDIRRGEGGTTHVRLDQTFGGIRVFGGDVVAHATGDEIVSLAGSLATHLGDFDITAKLSADDAVATAKKDFVGADGVDFTYDR